MSIYYILQDQRKCIGCLSCEVHCKSNKGLSVGPRLGQIIPVGPKMVGDAPPAGLRVHALLPLRRALVCARLPHRRHAPAPPGRHRLRGPVPVRGLQELHHRLPLGRPPMEPGDRQGGEVRLLHGPRRQGAEARLRQQVRHPLPAIRRKWQRSCSRTAGSTSPSSWPLSWTR